MPLSARAGVTGGRRAATTATKARPLREGMTSVPQEMGRGGVSGSGSGSGRGSGSGSGSGAADKHEVLDE